MSRPTDSEIEAGFRARFRAWRRDPIGFQVNVLDVKPEFVWPGMRAVAESVRDHQFTAVPSGHSLSKTFEAARLAVWFKTVFVPSTVITTAPSDNQVRNQLWREIHGAITGAKIPLGGNLTALQWDVRPSATVLAGLPPEARAWWEKNFAIGFATQADTAGETATKMQGWHNKWLLVVLDEAGGVHPVIWKTIFESLTINPRCKVLAIGNPTDPMSEFATVCEPADRQTDISKPYTSKRGWHVVPLSVKDSPNYVEGREVVPGLAGREYEQRIAGVHPPGSNGYLVRIEGKFPSYREGTFYGREVAQAEKDKRIDVYPWDPSFLVYRFADLGDIYTAAVDVQFIRDRIRVIGDYWDNAGQGATAFAKSMDCKPWVWGKQHFAGPDFAGSNAKSFQGSGKVVKDTLAGLGVNMIGVEPHSFEDGVEAARLIWPLLDIDKAGCPTLIQAAKAYGKKKNLALSREDQPVYYNEPAQSWERHIMDALRYLAIAYKYMPIGGQYLGPSRIVAAWHQAPKSAPARRDWLRRDRFVRVS